MNQVIIFFLHQNQNIFFSNIGNQNIFLEKKTYPYPICNLCKNNIEDEVHFLITCPLLEKFREPYIKNIKETYTNFSLLSDENKLIWLLSSEDKQIIIHLFGLLSTLFLERDKIIMNG